MKYRYHKCMQGTCTVYSCGLRKIARRTKVPNREILGAMQHLS